MSLREHRIELGVLTRSVLMMINQYLKRVRFKLSKVFSPPTELHLLIKPNLLYSSLLQELSRFSIFILSRHFKFSGVTIESWSLLAFYLTLTKFCRTTFSCYYFRCHELEFNCRCWTAPHHSSSCTFEDDILFIFIQTYRSSSEYVPLCLVNPMGAR